VGDLARSVTVRYALLIFMRDNASVITEANEGKSNYTWPMFLLSLTHFIQNIHYYRQNMIYVFYNNFKIFFVQIYSFTNHFSTEINNLNVSKVGL
jgi:hypothetical protein